jgi:hypothetical protein
MVMMDCRIGNRGYDEDISSWIVHQKAEGPQLLFESCRKRLLFILAKLEGAALQFSCRELVHIPFREENLL